MIESKKENKLSNMCRSNDNHLGYIMRRHVNEWPTLRRQAGFNLNLRAKVRQCNCSISCYLLTIGTPDPSDDSTKSLAAILLCSDGFSGCDSLALPCSEELAIFNSGMKTTMISQSLDFTEGFEILLTMS